jgi:hypothetical protein
VILYRGDSTSIAEFMVSRTDKGCLYGRGIYLTDNKLVAETYRTKEIPRRHRDKLSSILVDDYFESVEQALAKAFEKFSQRVDPDGNLLVRYYTGKIYPRHAQIIKQRWEAVKDLLIIKKGTAYCPVIRPYYVISLPILPAVGKLSTFEFEDRELYANTIGVKQRLDLEMRRLIAEKLNIDLVNLHISQLTSYKNFPWNKLPKVFEPYGYFGLRYKGGTATGSQQHNCFIIWDENYVNEHRINVG